MGGPVIEFEGDNVTAFAGQPVLATACSAVELGGIESLFEIEERWDALVARSADPTPFLRARWLRAWWEAFGRGRARVVAVHDGSGRLVGGAVFDAFRGRFERFPCRILALAANVHSNRADLLADAGCVDAVADAIAAWVHAERRTWTVLRADETPADGVAARAFLEALARRGHPVGVQAAARPPWIDLSAGMEAFEATLKSKWKSNLRNREKRLGQLGRVLHETVWCSLPDLDARLDDCFRMEALAWKGAAGSAILSDRRTLAFYRSIASGAAADGTLALHTLRVSGRLVAFQLDLVDGPVEYVLKIGYDPALSAYSPGALLLKRVIATAAARGMRAVDLLGDDMPWKRDWTSAFRPHVRAIAFARGPVGRAFWSLRFRALPAARRVTAKLRKGEVPA